MYRLVGFISIVVSVLAWPVAAAQPADYVMRGGVVWTVDESNPQAEALPIGNDRLLFVGSDQDVGKFIGTDTRVIDLRGRLVVPGFNDNHVHFDSTGGLLYGLNLLDVAGETEFTARVRDVHQRYSPGTWITGGDWSAYETWSAGAIAKAGAKVEVRGNPNPFVSR